VTTREVDPTEPAASVKTPTDHQADHVLRRTSISPLTWNPDIPTGLAFPLMDPDIPANPETKEETARSARQSHEFLPERIVALQSRHKSQTQQRKVHGRTQNMSTRSLTQSAVNSGNPEATGEATAESSPPSEDLLAIAKNTFALWGGHGWAHMEQGSMEVVVPKGDHVLGRYALVPGSNSWVTSFGGLEPDPAGSLNGEWYSSYTHT
jgi:hypothetical protein